MRKSLAIIASALLLAVAGKATHDRLRYDSAVFADSQMTGGPRATRVEYPPCVKGVREDRCIQLYERGVRRSYQRWLAANGRGERVAEAAPGRAYRVCRSRSDDRCVQRSGARRGAVRTARAQGPRRSAVRTAARQQVRRAAPTARATVRQQVRPAVHQRQRPGTRSSAPRRPTGGTPGI